MILLACGKIKDFVGLCEKYKKTVPLPASRLCASQLFVSQLFVSQLFVSQLWASPMLASTRAGGGGNCQGRCRHDNVIATSFQLSKKYVIYDTMSNNSLIFFWFGIINEWHDSGNVLTQWCSLVPGVRAVGIIGGVCLRETDLYDTVQDLHACMWLD